VKFLAILVKLLLGAPRWGAPRETFVPHLKRFLIERIINMTSIAPAIKLFLYDVLDVDPETLQSLSNIVSGSTVNFDVLLGSGALATNLAFYEAWKSATFGSPPSRIDYELFVKNLPGGNPSAGVTWSEPTHNAMVAALSAGTQIRIHQHHAKLVQSAGETYQRVLASVAGSVAGVKRLLYQKLSDRFGGNADPANSSPLITVYASLVLSDPRLKELEEWASGGNYVPPKSIQEYYDRATSSGKKLGLPHKDPLTKLVMDLGIAVIPPLSCIELLRTPLSRDGHLWRRDSGGSLFVIGKDYPFAKEITEVASKSTFKFRTSGGIPTNLLYNALPLLVYSRVVIADDKFESTARGPGEVVRLITSSSSSHSNDLTKPREIVMSDVPPSNASSTYWIPFPSVFHLRRDDLRLETVSSILSHHLQSPCPLRSPTNQIGGAPSGGDLLFHKFVSTYVHARNLDTRVFSTPADGIGKTGEVVLLDNRINVWSIWSILVTLDNLRTDEGDWSVTVFCSNTNVEFVRKTLLPRVPNARIEVLDALNKSPFDIETYNGVLKSLDFWDKIRSPRALIVQDDGVLVRPGLDDDKEILSQDFVGAPWIDVPENRKMLESAGVGSGLVGNGGFSLRNVESMKEIIRTDGDSDHGHATFCGNLQPVPEDVYFASALNRRGKGCSREVAERFAFEEKLPTSNAPLGFHKPWPYNKPADLAKYFDNLLSGLPLALRASSGRASLREAPQGGPQKLDQNSPAHDGDIPQIKEVTRITEIIDYGNLLDMD
jgi:hypothetical protein